jgi:predicted acetyltransferase
MPVEIRELELEEAIQGLPFLSSYAFTPTPPLPNFDSYAERIRQRKGSRYFGALEEGQLQAISCATTPLVQNLRGGLFPMGGIANVATHPAARRKGYARLMMTRLFQEFKETQVAASCLYPFKEAFYLRLGYAPLPQPMRIIFDPHCLLPLLKMDLDVSYELVSYAEGYHDYRAFCQQVQKRTHGMALFAIPQEEAAQSHEAWLLFARKGNSTLGVMNYTLKDQILNQTLLAYDFIFSSMSGRFALLNWIARHIDQAGKVILTLKPGQMGENYFTDIRPEFQGVFVPPMARVIDLTALEGLPCGEGDICIGLTDEHCAWNHATWRLFSQGGRLQITPAGQPDCSLTIHGLSALIYGVTDPEEFSLRRWGDPDPDQQAILRSLFPPAIPYLHAMY